jgi:hypothetical protein
MADRLYVPNLHSEKQFIPQNSICFITHTLVCVYHSGSRNRGASHIVVAKTH